MEYNTFSMKGKGFFIIVDGPSASGKDTIIKQILKDLRGLGIKVITIEETKEKSYDRKKILTAKQHGDQELVKVIINERNKLYQKTVIPQLLAGTFVIANRGEPTTLGYQTLKQKPTMESVWNSHRKQGIPLPNLIVIANCSVDEAIRRENLRKPSFEEKDKSFMSGKFTPLYSQKEELKKRKLIHANYENVKNFLNKKGLNVIYINTDSMDVPKACRRIVSFIKKISMLLR